MNKEKMREQFDKYAEAKIQDIAAQLTGRLSRELIDLQALFPRRRLWFFDAMGSATIHIEVFRTGHGVYEHDGGFFLPIRFADQRYGDLFAEHDELLDWYNEKSQEFRIEVDQMTIGQKWPLKRNA